MIAKDALKHTRRMGRKHALHSQLENNWMHSVQTTNNARERRITEGYSMLFEGCP